MLLGIDVGTGGTRAVLVDLSGAVVASSASEHAGIHSRQIGWAEQDPEDWWRATCKALAGWMTASQLAGGEIKAVGLTGQMHGCVMLDADGRVLL
jgi:xylulokinase